MSTKINIILQYTVHTQSSYLQNHPEAISPIHTHSSRLQDCPEARSQVRDTHRFSCRLQDYRKGRLPVKNTYTHILKQFLLTGPPQGKITGQEHTHTQSSHLQVCPEARSPVKNTHLNSSHLQDHPEADLLVKNTQTKLPPTRPP